MAEKKEEYKSRLKEYVEVVATIAELFEDLSEKYGANNEIELMAALHTTIDELTQSATESVKELKIRLRIFIKYLTTYHLSYQDFEELYNIYDKMELLANIHTIIDEMAQNQKNEELTKNSQLKIKLREYIEALLTIQELYEKLYKKYGINDKVELRISITNIIDKICS